MLISSALFAAVAVAAVGSLVCWSNPSRWVNRIVFSCSLHIAIWLVALNLTLTSGNGLFWLRWTTSIAAMIPLHFWLVKEAIASDFQELRAVKLRRIGGWLFVTLLLAVVCFTNYFIPAVSTQDRRIYGFGYYFYIVGSLGLYVALAFDSVRRIKSLTGGRRLALQVWLGGGCAAAGTILTLMTANAFTHNPTFIRVQPLVVLIYYAGTAFAITTYRIFDARQVLLLGLEKSLLIIAVASAAFLLDLLLKSILPEPFGFLVTTALALWLAVTLDGRLDRMFHFYPKANEARQAAYAVTRRETKVESMEKAFLDILKGWGQAEHAVVLSGSAGPLRGGGLELPEDSAVIQALRQLRWATPERLVRERSTPEREVLARFLEKQELGALVVGQGPALTVLVGVGVAASRRPFTYPQITQLLELASIIENSLERAHFSVKAQRAEQLATVGLLGASLAHEIRNPLVSIKAFVQLLPEHYQDPAFRAKFFSLIGDEVMRIERLTEQLLDLASPRVYSAQTLQLHPVLHSSLELVAAKAADKHIQFRTDFRAAPDQVYTDASAAKQVLLNLCFNAIQAIEATTGDRWVKISTRNTVKGVEVILEDSGPGISPEIRPRLFQPFQSTKSSGFGLGLAICSDILAGLDATITVDPTVPGQGATFRIVFPCQAS